MFSFSHLIAKGRIPLGLRRAELGRPNHPAVAQEHIFVGEKIVGAHIANAEFFELSYELPVDDVAFERDTKIGEISAQVHE